MCTMLSPAAPEGLGKGLALRKVKNKRSHITNAITQIRDFEKEPVPGSFHLFRSGIQKQCSVGTVAQGACV